LAKLDPGKKWSEKGQRKWPEKTMARKLIQKSQTKCGQKSKFNQKSKFVQEAKFC